jgi:predicted Fe-Mo cluster-binding NifX family protein
LKVALAAWETRISPVFDSTHLLLVVEIENGRVVGKRYETMRPELPYTRAARLSRLGISVLICGAISIEYASVIEMYGIQVIPFVAGQAHHVLNAYLNGLPGLGSDHVAGFRAGGRRRMRGRQG